MKKLVLSLMLGFIALNAFSNPVVGGDTTRINGKLVLYLMADHEANGWYYGYLLGDRIMEIMDNYVINHAFGGAPIYQMAREIFSDHFTVDDKYAVMAQGMILGMQSAGFSTFSNALGENLTYVDVLIANSIPDFTAFGLLQIDGPGCSNLTSWGEATINDPLLNGETVISRNLDWENHPQLIDNPLIIVWASIDPFSQRFVTFGYPGMIGALSGINESGIATFQNMGNYSPSATGTGFYPVNLAQRNGLEAADYNMDGICSPRDITDAVSEHNVSSTYIIHSAGPSGLEIPAEILEIHNQFGSEIRTVDNNATSFGNNLVATNHFRLLKPPSYCYRYNKISDSLVNSSHMSVNRNWNVLTSAGVNTNLQTIQYSPYNHLLRLSFAEPGIPAYQLEPVIIDAGELFQLVSIKENSLEDATIIQVFPNPCSHQTHIMISPDIQGTASCKIYSRSGELIYDFGVLPCNDTDIELHWNAVNNADGIYLFIVDLKSEAGLRKTYSHKIVVNR